jgi:hypothetical protein
MRKFIFLGLLIGLVFAGISQAAVIYREPFLSSTSQNTPNTKRPFTDFTWYIHGGSTDGYMGMRFPHAADPNIRLDNTGLGNAAQAAILLDTGAPVTGPGARQTLARPPRRMPAHLPERFRRIMPLQERHDNCQGR